MLRFLFLLVDVITAPFALIAGCFLYIVRRIGFKFLPLSGKVLGIARMLPVVDHYYEPYVGERHLVKPLDQERDLPGINWNRDGQLEILKAFHYGGELKDAMSTEVAGRRFSIDNGAFASGDIEFFFNMVRLKKPRRVFEVGSGHSTLVAMMAIAANRREDAGYECRHLCVEPYEMPWLEKSGLEIVRRRVEEVGGDLFSELDSGDILFIDSSHVIRPQGDVLFEYLELLPTLKPGVIVHIHDVFSPRDYLKEWVVDQKKLWNEQYLLEAFLTHNRDWRVIGAVNDLKHRHYDLLKEKCPFLSPEREPGSFYIERIF